MKELQRGGISPTTPPREGKDKTTDFDTWQTLKDGGTDSEPYKDKGSTIITALVWQDLAKAKVQLADTLEKEIPQANITPLVCTPTNKLESNYTIMTYDIDSISPYDMPSMQNETGQETIDDMQVR